MPREIETLHATYRCPHVVSKLLSIILLTRTVRKNRNIEGTYLYLSLVDSAL